MKHINLKNTEDRGRKGDFAEFYAVTWLWDKGYEVFKNCGSTGLIDLVAIKDGEITLIDVKTWCYNEKTKAVDISGSPRTEEQVQLGVKQLGFYPDTRKLKFVAHRT